MKTKSLIRLLSRAEAADCMAVSTRTVDRLIADGSLRAHKLDRSVRVSEEDLQRFIASSRR